MKDKETMYKGFLIQQAYGEIWIRKPGNQINQYRYGFLYPDAEFDTCGDAEKDLIKAKECIEKYLSEVHDETL